MPGGEELAPEQWQTGWSEADHVVDVPGNHFTMLEDLADTTAGAVDAWLRERRVLATEARQDRRRGRDPARGT